MAESTQAALPSHRIRRTAGIASASSFSSAIDLHGYRVTAIDWSSGATAAFALSFQGSPDGSSFFDIYDATGTQIAVASGAMSTAEKRTFALTEDQSRYLSAHRYLKVRAGLSSAPVTLGATAQSFDVILDLR